jgi:hypothetical protein
MIENLRSCFRRVGKGEDVPYIVGRQEINGFRFSLSRFPSSQRKGYDLKIRFNPATLINGHNLYLERPEDLRQSMERLQNAVDSLGLALKVESLPIAELHLARDVALHNDAHWKELLDYRAQEVLRFLGWLVPPRSRVVKVYDNADKRLDDDDEVVEEGLKRGNKSWEWTIYDKTLERREKGYVDERWKGQSFVSNGS